MMLPDLENSELLALGCTSPITLSTLRFPMTLPCTVKLPISRSGLMTVTWAERIRTTGLVGSPVVARR